MPNNVLGLTREQLTKFLPDPQSIRAFEKLVIDATTTTPENVEAVTNIANSALAMAAAAISQLSELVEALDAALSAPADTPPDEQEDFVPNYSGSFGTLAYQNDDEVEITGGSITGVAISGGSGSFTNITYSGQLTSTIATGTAPMVVASTTKVVNLNVDLLDGADWASPAGIGTTAANTGAFTSLTASSTVTLSPANANVTISPTGTGTATFAPATAGTINNMSIGATTPQNGTFKTLQTDGSANVLLGTSVTSNDVIARGANSGASGGSSFFAQNNGVAIVGIGNKSRLLGGAYDATPYVFANATLEVGPSTKFLSTTGFNNTNPIAKPTVTGSRAGNAALASLLTALANYGLVTDSSTV